MYYLEEYKLYRSQVAAAKLSGGDAVESLGPKVSSAVLEVLSASYASHSARVLELVGVLLDPSRKA